LNFPVAACTSDSVIAKVGAAPLLALNDIDPAANDPRITQVQRTTRDAVTACRRSQAGSTST
jgi:hypothetical protein